MQVRPLKHLEIVTQLTEKYTTDKTGSRKKRMAGTTVTHALCPHFIFCAEHHF